MSVIGWYRIGVTPIAWVLAASFALAAGAAPTSARAEPQHPYPGSWPQPQFDHRHSGFNRYEGVLSPSNVGRLVQKWSTPIDYYLNTAAVARGVLYTTTSGDEYPGVYALDANTGHRLWYQGAVSYVSWAPAVARDRVFVAEDRGTVAAVGAPTGAVLWTRSVGDFNGPPTYANGVVYVSAGSTLYALEDGTGAVLWTAQPTASSLSAAAVAAGVVFVSAGDGRVYAFDAKGCHSPPCSPVWTGNAGSAQQMTSPSVTDGVVYVAGDAVYAFDANGCESDAECAPMWMGDSGTVSSLSSLAVAYGSVYAPALDGTLAVFAAGGCGQEVCRPAWSASAGTRLITSAAVANRVLYVVSFDSSDGLFAFKAKGCGALICKPIARITRGLGLRSSPVVVGGRVYAQADSYMKAFGLP